jgi:hypothetical protein
MLRTKLGRRMVAATLGLACILGAATASQARVLVSGVRVKCTYQNETGADEIFMKFNGARLNMGNFTNGRDYTSPSTLIVSSLPVNMELWESDGDHLWDGDDWWGGQACQSFGYCSGQSIQGGWQNHYYDYSATMSFIQ